MAQHRLPRSRRGAAANPRSWQRESAATEITDIIPFAEFGDLASKVRESDVTPGPKPGDVRQADDVTTSRLSVPEEFRTASVSPGRARETSHAYRDSHTDVSDGSATTAIIAIPRRGGAAHRKATTGPVKSRVMIAAMAAGATAAGAYTLSTGTESEATDTVLAAGQTAMSAGVVTGSVEGMQIVSVASTVDSSVHAEEITKAAAFAQERAEREARLSRPQFVMPTRGVWTSGFGYRWGVLHGGIDIANSIGTPILAAADGVVIDVGPTAGYGAWVKLRHADGTVTLYGHINTWLVSVGQRVMAGDQIATMGNRGNSTGPHLHFEVLLDGTNRVDPTGWLAKRGLSPGSYVG